MPEEIVVEYFLNYETSVQKLGAEMQFSTLETGFNDSKPIEVSEKVYKDAEEALHMIL